jgi:hypothetical protein
MDSQRNPEHGEAISLEDLYTVQDLAAAYPKILTEAALRWQLRFRDTNGLERACVRVGKKLLVHRPRYEHWLATGAKANPGAAQ